jgi:hypothetical protein
LAALVALVAALVGALVGITVNPAGQSREGFINFHGISFPAIKFIKEISTQFMGKVQKPKSFEMPKYFLRIYQDLAF